MTPELAELVAAFDQIVFIDAEPAPDGDDLDPARIRELGPLGARESLPSVLGHHQDPRAVLALAGRLFGHTPRAWLVTIVARSFALGATPSLPYARGTLQAVELVEALAGRRAGARRSLTKFPAAVPTG